MMKVLKYGDAEIKSWCSDLEAECLKQAINLSNFPYLFKHVCLMPDAHVGYGMPIGGVVALDNVISPNMVGVDIGCGMCAVKTDLVEIDQHTIKKIIKQIRDSIPLGFKHHSPKNAPSKQLLPKYDDRMSVIKSEIAQLHCQLGTLGGGNHFLEVQKSNDGHIWFMVHSGSRNIGLKVASHYNKIASKINNRMGELQAVKYGLAFLPLDDREGQDYLQEMKFCLQFAHANRQLMSDRIKESFADHLDCKFLDEVNIHHNYACKETHFGKEVMVHRKGATSAQLDELGIIPGSQGENSYIVRGLGNVESFCSCSHGAGRKMGRKEAIRSLNLEQEIKKLDDLGVIHSIRKVADLDEAPSAYKDISVVMSEQSDLVDIMVELAPLAVIKG